MIWRNVIKGIIKASLPTIILPAIVVGVVIRYFGFTLDSLIAILFLGEFYIIWAQLEVALRQTRLSVLEYEPEFKIEVERKVRTGIVEGGENRFFFNLRLVNVGKHLSRNIFVSIDVKGKKEEHKSIPFANMSPNEPVNLCRFDENLYNNNTITVDVNYENIMGELSGMSFLKEPKLPAFIVGRRLRMPGLLLNSFEDLMLILRLFTFSRRAKKLREEMKKTRNTHQQ